MLNIIPSLTWSRRKSSKYSQLPFGVRIFRLFAFGLDPGALGRLVRANKVVWHHDGKGFEKLDGTDT
jgi:hypothetical protein